MRYHAVFLSLLLGCCGAFANACEVRIAYNEISSFPYYTGDSSTTPEPPGIVIEILRDVLSKLDCQLHLQRMPNKRVQAETEQGKWDGMLLFSYSPERAQQVVYPQRNGALDSSRRLATLTYEIYVTDGSPVTWDGHQFSNLRRPIAVNSGYSAAANLRDMDQPIDEASSTLQNFEKLQRGRVSAYVMLGITGDAMLQKYHLSGIHKLPQPFRTKDYFLPFSKTFYRDHRQLAEAIWDAYAQVRDSRTQLLMTKYLE